MPVNMYWGNAEKTLYIAEYVGEWTWEEFYPAVDAANRDFDTIDHTVDIIHDWSQSKRIPSDIMAHARNLIKRMHPRTGVSVHVGANNLFMQLWRIFNRLYNTFANQKKFLFADTIEEAKVMLAEVTQKS